MTTEPRTVVLDAVSEALGELGREATHKVITAHVFERLREHGYTIVRTEAAS